MPLSYHVCALLENSKVRCWGWNNYGQLGLGHTNSIGDNEHPETAGDIQVGQNVLDIATSEPWHLFVAGR